MAGATMEAAVYHGRADVTIEERPVPEPGPGEVLIEVARCGICGSDVHLVLDGFAKPGSILGHEWSGRIAALGPGVEGWAVGDRVVHGPAPGCGQCRACRRGRPSVCRRRGEVDHLDFSGAYAPYLCTEASRLLRIPDEVDDRAAALTEPLAVALHAITLSEVETGDRVLVSGGGPIGQLVTAALRARGVEDVTVSEPSPLRRARALEAGARRVVEPQDLEMPIGVDPVSEPYDVVFECSGNKKAIMTGLDQLDSAGRLMIVGNGGEMPRLSHNRVCVLELSVVGSFNYDAGGFEQALALLASGQLPLDVLIDPVEIGLGELMGTIQSCAAGERPAKVLVDPSR